MGAIKRIAPDGAEGDTMRPAWDVEFPGSITVCDVTGTIVWMNRRAIEGFAEEGGEKLIGTSLLDCHPEPARSIIEELLQSRRKNIYTIEKKGKKKIIYQSPWYDGDSFAGLVELSLEIPFEMPHFVRA